MDDETGRAGALRDPALFLLVIDLPDQPERQFDKETCGSMFGMAELPQDVLLLRKNGEDVLRIPWPDGMTLDDALKTWAIGVEL